MGFLRRILGAQPSRGIAPNHSTWYDLPDSGYFKVAGVGYYTAEISRVVPLQPTGHDPRSLDLTATVERDPENQYDANAVAVRLNGQLAGHIDAEHALAWSAFLARVEGEGYRGASVPARLWIGNEAYFLDIRADEDARYPLPSEAAAYYANLAQQQAEYERQREQQQAELEQRRVDREQARADRAARLRQVSGRRQGVVGVAAETSSALRADAGRRRPTARPAERRGRAPSRVSPARVPLQIRHWCLRPLKDESAHEAMTTRPTTRVAMNMTVESRPMIRPRMKTAMPTSTSPVSIPARRFTGPNC